MQFLVPSGVLDGEKRDEENCGPKYPVATQLA